MSVLATRAKDVNNSYDGTSALGLCSDFCRSPPPGVPRFRFRDARPSKFHEVPGLGFSRRPNEGVLCGAGEVGGSG